MPWWVGAAVGMGAGLLSSLFGGSRKPRYQYIRRAPSLLPFTEPAVPQISGLQGDLGGSLTYGMAGPINSQAPGLSIGILGGKTRVGTQIINGYVRHAGSYDVGHLLCAVCEGEVQETVVDNSAENVWVTEHKKLSETKGTFQTAVGTSTQEALTYFESLHQNVPVNEDMRVPTKVLLHVYNLEVQAGDGLTGSDIYGSGWAPNNISHAGLEYGMGVFSTGSTAICIRMSSLSSAYYEGNVSTNTWSLQPLQDFCYESFVYPNSSISTATYHGLFKWQNEADDVGWCLGLAVGTASTRASLEIRANSDGTFAEYTVAKSTEFSISVGTTGDTSAADWTHLTFARWGGEYLFFVDGTQKENIKPHLNEDLPDASANVEPLLGRKWTGAADSSNYFGLMDEIRFMRGVCPYTRDFTVPTERYEPWDNLSEVTTKNQVDQVNFQFMFPQGIYDGTGADQVRYMVYFKDSAWDNSHYEWFRRSTDGEIPGAGSLPYISENHRSPYKLQFEAPFKCINYDGRTTSTSVDFGPQQTGGLTTRRAYKIKGQTSSAEALVWKDYQETSTSGTLFLFDFSSNGQEFQENETIQIIEGGSTNSSNTAVVDAVPTGTDPIVAGKAVYYRRSNYSFYAWRQTRDPAGQEVSDMHFMSMDEVMHETLTYPNTALISLRYPYGGPFKGTDLGPISVVANRGTVDIQTWAGSTAKDTSIPAWFALDLHTNKRFGKAINVSNLSSADFTAWETHTEGTVNGTKRANWNGIIDTQMGFKKALAEVEKVGRARIIETGSKRRVMLEKTGTASQLFTSGNIVTASYGLVYLPKTGRPHGFRVWYNDATKNYKKTDILYRGPDYDTTTEPLNIPEEYLIGCTNEDQAKRYAILRYQLATMPNCQTAFEAGIDAMGVLPGDIVRVINDSNQFAVGGRVVAADSTGVLIDRNFNEPSSWSGFTDFCYRISTSDELKTVKVNQKLDADSNPYHSINSTQGYGNLTGVGDTDHKDAVYYAFEHTSSTGIVVGYDLYDVDYTTEVFMNVNGTPIATAHGTVNDDWLSFTATVSTANISSANINVISFTQQESTAYKWGVRNVRIASHALKGGTLYTCSSGSWASTPSNHDVYAVYHRGLADPIDFRVLESNRTQSGHYRISAIEYVDAAYYHDDYGTTEI